MQTFLPYSDFKQSAKCLDYRRLGKQRLEGKQILTCLEYIRTGNLTKLNKHGKLIPRGWINHAAVKMWIGYSELLKIYTNVIIEEWVERGYKNTMKLYDINDSDIIVPSWLGNLEFHKSHQSNLLRKNPKFYIQYNWDVSDDLPYIWPNSEKL